MAKSRDVIQVYYDVDWHVVRRVARLAMSHIWSRLPARLTDLVPAVNLDCLGRTIEDSTCEHGFC